ncbi:class A beta-lactamase-related serine hydrolase [Kitasatospora xanthocidica]|uniref:Class A beta-lactamase-related serine hydrolase n=1 Tax=Kitasatospora xanthocidica TaxID=83382 RepID=A0A372ZY68_9ACTN|nr:serine hydrolase domain-containing protein [Kitasatospora xanthocidica]RGD60372.1 class A beta-lactamase-related serine hydrolase [Kitasatospora xanthocidica]
MNSPARTGRWSVLVATGALLAAATVGVATIGAATPALAAAASQATSPATSPSAVDTTASATARPGPLDRESLAETLHSLPSGVTGALVRVGGQDARWRGTSGEDVPANARFRIGSVTKVFTATVLLQLAGEGRVDLDGTVQQYLPGLLPAGYPPVTVRQLLNHTSGLPGGGGMTSGDGSTAWFAAHKAVSYGPQQVVADMLTQPRSFEPGAAQQYNGNNYFVAALVIEKVTGDDYADQVRRRITGPLGLHATYVPAADDLTIRGPHATGYVDVRNADGSTARADVTEQSPYPWAEGGMISSAADLERFFEALYRGRLLRPAQQAEVFAVPDLPNEHNKNCEIGPTAGHACYSTAGLLRTVLPNGTEVWGKNGSRPGYTTGVFATRDFSRSVVIGLNPTGITGEEFPTLWKLVTTGFGSGQAYGQH